MRKLSVGKIFTLKLIHFSVITALHFITPAHAGHLQKLLPQQQLKKSDREYSPEISARFMAWEKLIEDNRDKPALEQVDQVNRFFNQIKWVDDDTLWKQRDYWATPTETLIKNAGDCEDFSIAKYFTLLELGIPQDQLRVTYTRLKSDQQAHMVLAYFEENTPDPFILDNIDNSVARLTERSDLIPMFHFNSEHVWDNKQPNQVIDKAENIKPWVSLLHRM